MIALSPFLTLLMFGALVYGVVRLLRSARHGGQGGTTVGPHDLRERLGQLFRLLVLFGVVVLVAEGLAGLLSEALPRRASLVRDPDTVARSLAFVVVGLPVLAGLARWSATRLRTDPQEERSGGWSLYLTVTTSLALIFTLVGLDASLRYAFAGDTYDPDAIGRALTWSVVWALHWRLLARRSAVVAAELAPAVLIGSVIGLAAGGFGVGRLVASALRLGYDAAFTDVLVVDSTGALGRAAVAAIVGLATWLWHWPLHGVRAPRDRRWHSVVLLGGNLGGLAAAVVGAAQLLHTTLQWFFGDPHTTQASAHFSGVSGSTAAFVVGGVVWAYHRSLLGRPPLQRPRDEIDRIADYLAAGVGVVCLALGVTVAVAALGEAIGTSNDVGGATPVANTVVFAVTMIAVGGGVWGWFWSSAQRSAGRSPAAERHALSRRVYLALVLGVSAVVGLISLVVLATMAFEDVARSRAGLHTVFRIRVPAGLVIATAAVAAYHGLVVRDDRRATALLAPADGGRPPLREVIVVSSDTDAVADALRAALGVRVLLWPCVDDVVLPTDLAPTLEAVRDQQAQRVLVIAHPNDAPEVIGLR